MTYVFLFGGILLVLLAVVVLAALRDGGGVEDGVGSAEARLDAALEALREVEFDYRTDKLPEEEYRELRGRWGRRALAARAEIEAPRPERPSGRAEGEDRA